MNKSDLLRLGAVLHNLTDNSSFNEILRRLIGFSFFRLNCVELTSDEITKFLSGSEGVDLHFSPSEIIDCCREYETQFSVVGGKDYEVIQISHEYLADMVSDYRDLDLDRIIEDFYNVGLSQKIRSKKSLKNVIKAIHVYLYKVLLDSQVDYQKLLSVYDKESVDYLQKIEDGDLINEFIEWDDENKNSMLGSLYGVGIEFAILSAKKNLLDTTRFSDKVIYLDTNVIYRILGLNGPELKDRMSRFFDEFKSKGIQFRVSPVTLSEFSESLSQQVVFFSQNLSSTRKYTINKFAGLNRHKYTTYQYYLDWVNKKTGATIATLIPHIEKSMDKIFKKYEILIERQSKKPPYTKEDVDSLLEEYLSVRFSQRKSESIIRNDMKNYMYILCHREKDPGQSLNDDKYFLLSTDYEFSYFDNLRKENRKVVLHPARLYSLMLTFDGRVVSTDLMSFIKLLRVDITTEDRISEDTLAIINDHLNRYEPDEDLQKPYVDALIDANIMEELENEDAMGKRRMLHDLFERTSKRLSEEAIAQNQKDRDEKTRLIEENERLSNFKNNVIKFGVSIILSVIFVAGYFALKLVFDMPFSDNISIPALTVIGVLVGVFVPFQRFWKGK